MYWRSNINEDKIKEKEMLDYKNIAVIDPLMSIDLRLGKELLKKYDQKYNIGIKNLQPIVNYKKFK